MRGFVFLAFYSLHCTMVDSAGGQCIPGTYTLTSGASCIYCPIGKYKAGFGNVLSCTTCPAGTYAINTGSTACIACGTDCMPGYYSTGCTATNKGTCITCPVCTTDNYYTAGCTGNSPGTCTPCATCAAGTYMAGCTGTSQGTCTTCPSCNTGYYAPGCTGSSPGLCVPISNIVVPGSCNSESSCDFANQAPYESYQCSGNTFPFSDLNYASGTCNVVTDTGRVRITEPRAISVIVNITGNYNPFVSVSVLLLGTQPSLNAYSNAGTAVWADPTSSPPLNQYYIYNTVLELAVNTIYLSFLSSSVLGNADPLAYFNVTYWWRYPCAACTSTQYLQGCSPTSQGTCIQCQTCSNGYTLSGCGGSSAGSCVACTN